MRIALLLALLLPATSIRLENNGYKDVLVAIKSEIAEDPSLVDTIKKVFTEASDYLYAATKKRAYFAEITIVVPEAWKMGVDASATASETFGRAPVRVNPPQVFFGIESNSAFVESTALCGGEGLYMHLTPKRLSDKSLSLASPPHRMIVHEWAHLRWGVFDEYFQSYYGLDNDARAGRCPQKITATSVSGRWRYSLNTVSGSVMWKQYYNQVADFCDDGDDSDTRHYRSSNTAQNKFCNMQSIWEVMRSTEDFLDGANPPRDVQSTVPRFRVVKKMSNPIICLLLDTSNSMANNGRIIKLRQAAKNYINRVAAQTQICIIDFDTTATVVQTPIAVTDEASRDRLGKRLPDEDDVVRSSLQSGQTNLTNAVLEGIRTVALATNMNRELVLVTDGVSTQGPRLTDPDVVTKIVESRVRIHTIGIGAADTDLSKLSDLTGGMAFADLESASQPAAMQEAFNELSSGSDEISYETAHLISTGNFNVASRKTKKSAFCVDAGVGRDTEVIFYYGDYSYKKLRIKLTAPECATPPEPNVSCGKLYKSKDKTIECRDAYSTCSILIPRAKDGEWLLSIYNSNSFETDVSFTVTSKQADPDVDAIHMETFLNSKTVTLTAVPMPTVTITALLVRGPRAVVRATVVAVISRPEGDSVNIYLRDEGAGPDLFKNDGLYSGTFTQLTTSGTYNVKVIATNNRTTNMNMSDVTSGSKRMEEFMNREAEVKFRFPRDDLDFQQDFEKLSEDGTIHREEFDSDVGKFMRAKSAGSFLVEAGEMDMSADMYTPSRIMDLKGAPRNEGSRVVTITWTAPGDDMETGTASSYSVRVSKKFDDLARNFGAQTPVDSSMIRKPRTTDLNEPAMAGLPETLSFRNPFKNADTIYVAVRTGDNDGRMSALSNIAPVQMNGMCFCPEKDLCQHPYLLLGQVIAVDDGSLPLVAIFSPDTKIIRPDISLPLAPPVIFDLNRDGFNCDCPTKLEVGKRYLMTASFHSSEVRLEVLGENYVEEIDAGADLNAVLASVRKTVLEEC